ncbi:MAG: ribonuclease III [Acidobacteria bacterium]|nr:ribonuclease III [Acidobacteriota bacterium]
MPPGSLRDLEDAIGYSFRSPDWLRQALTHRSHTEEVPCAGGELANEQMEFLGDSILGFVVSEALVERFPDYREGRLSKLKAHLVSAAHLHPVAERLEIGRFLLLGKGEEQSGGRAKKALLVNTLEALVAAIYQDGGMAPARQFVRRWILDSVDWAQPPSADFKTELQEILQERRAAPPRYQVVSERGPEHQKLFTIELRIGGEQFARAEGQSKKAAEQAAAEIALRRLRESEIEHRNRKTS